MATKKVPATKTASPAAAKTSVAPAKNATAVKKMTKSQLIQLVAEKVDLDVRQAAIFFDVLFTIAIEETKETGEFTIPELGKLVKVQRAERMGRNPQTGESIKIDAKTTVKFRVAKAALDAIGPGK